MEIRANSIKITLALAILFTPLTGLHGGEQTASKSEWFKKYVPLATGIYLVALGESWAQYGLERFTKESPI